MNKPCTVFWMLVIDHLHACMPLSHDELCHTSSKIALLFMPY